MRIFIFVALLIFTSSHAFASFELIDAAISGDITQIENLLQQGSGVDVNFIESGVSKKSALHFAAEAGQVNALNVLLFYGATIDLPDLYGSTALHYAAEEGHVAVVDSLIFHGANIHLTNSYGETALHCAAYFRRLGVLDSLISHGANIDLPDNSGRTALHIAAETGDLDIFNSLLSHGADIDLVTDSGVTAAQLAAMKQFSKIVGVIRSVRKKRALRFTDSALTVAIKKGNMRKVKALLESGIEVTESDIQLAQDCKYINIIHYLIQFSEFQSYLYLVDTTDSSKVILPEDNLLMIREYLFGRSSFPMEGQL